MRAGPSASVRRLPLLGAAAQRRRERCVVNGRRGGAASPSPSSSAAARWDCPSSKRPGRQPRPGRSSRGEERRVYQEKKNIPDRECVGKQGASVCLFPFGSVRASQPLRTERKAGNFPLRVKAFCGECRRWEFRACQTHRETQAANGQHMRASVRRTTRCAW